MIVMNLTPARYSRRYGSVYLAFIERVTVTNNHVASWEVSVRMRIIINPLGPACQDC